LYNLQGQSSLVFLADNFMLGPLLRTNVYHRFVVGRNSVRTNDIVLAFSETSRSGRCRRQATRVLKLKVLDKLCLSRLLEEDLSKVNDFLVVVSENNLSCEVGLLDGEDGKRMRGSHDWQRGEGEDGMSRGGIVSPRTDTSTYIYWSYERRYCCQNALYPIKHVQPGER